MRRNRVLPKKIFFKWFSFYGWKWLCMWHKNLMDKIKMQTKSSFVSRTYISALRNNLKLRRDLKNAIFWRFLFFCDYISLLLNLCVVVIKLKCSVSNEKQKRKKVGTWSLCNHFNISLLWEIQVHACTVCTFDKKKKTRIRLRCLLFGV